MKLYQFLVFSLIMVSERTHNGLYKMRELGLAYARRAYQTPHLAAKS